MTNLKKDPRPNNMPWLTPYLIVPDVEKTAAFYEKAFGFKLGTLMKDDEGTAEFMLNFIILMSLLL